MVSEGRGRNGIGRRLRKEHKERQVDNYSSSFGSWAATLGATESEKDHEKNEDAFKPAEKLLQSCDLPKVVESKSEKKIQDNDLK